MPLLLGWSAKLARDSGASGDVPVGVGIPGAVSPTSGLIKNANSTCLIGQVLAKVALRIVLVPFLITGGVAFARWLDRR